MIWKIRHEKQALSYSTPIFRKISGRMQMIFCGNQEVASKIPDKDANIKLSSVLSDIFGVTGQKILRDIIAGDYQPEKLLYHVHGKVQKSREEIKEAITGNVSAHHRFMMQTILESIAKTEDTIQKLDAQIALHTTNHGLEIELLDKVPGVDKDGAIGIIAEIGDDMSAFPSERHSAKWAGMCPGNNESGGKKKWTTKLWEYIYPGFAERVRLGSITNETYLFGQ